MNCRNCGRRIDVNFCSHCGQSSKVGRINLSNFLNELSEGVFQINKGFFYTLRVLFVRPGNALQEFLDGKRKNHFKPIAYVLTLSTIYFLITKVTGQSTWIDDLISGWLSGSNDEGEAPRSPAVLTWASKNFAYSSLLLLPVFSLASYWAFYKFGKNYLEHIVINAYITGQQAIFYALFAVIGLVVEVSWLEALPSLIAVSYTFWVFSQLFSGTSRVTNLLRSAMAYLIYMIFSFGIIIIATAFNDFLGF